MKKYSENHYCLIVSDERKLIVTEKIIVTSVCPKIHYSNKEQQVQINSDKEDYKVFELSDVDRQFCRILDL